MPWSAPRTRRGRARQAVALATVLGTLAGCGGSGGVASGGGAGTAGSTTSGTAPPSASLTVTSFEYSYEASGPVNLAAGKVLITLRNGGTEAHNAQVVRLKEGVSDAVVARAATDDPTGAELLALGARGAVRARSARVRSRRASRPWSPAPT